MRFLSLDLIAFGPFTNLSVDLSGGSEGLHLIYGRNESGKSSALRALRQFLYGIPRDSTDNFIHAHTNMRIGATIKRADGSVIKLIRRKGMKNTLRDGDDDKPIDESVLRELLSGIDQEQFVVMFGMDHEALKRGGQDLLVAGSHLGQILFSAGASIAGVQTVLASLDADARELFKPTGVNPRINEALRQLSDLRSQLKNKQLSHSDWSKHDHALSEALKQKERCERELSTTHSQLRRLDRLRQARPMVAQRALTQQALQGLAEVVSLPADFAERVREQLNRRQNAIRGHKEAAEAIAELEKQLQAIRIPEELLKHTESIDGLHKELGGHIKAAQDRVKLETQLRDCEAEAFNLVKSLGKSIALDDCDKLRITSQQKARLQELMRKAEAVQAASLRSREQRTRLEKDLALKGRQLSQLPAEREITPLQAEIRRLHKLGPIEQQLEDLAAGIAHLNAQLDNSKHKLSLAGRDNAEVAKLPVPLPETVEKFREDLARSESAVEEITHRIQELVRALDKTQQDIDKLELEMDVPTEGALGESRERRNRGWQMIKAWWMDGEHNDEDISSFTGGAATAQSLARTYEHSVVLSDEISDRLRREAQRVGKKASLLAQRTEIERQIADAEDKQSRAIASRQDIERRWAELWSAVGIAALTPREMGAWRNRFDKLTELIDQAREKQVEQARLTEQMHRAKESIALALRSAGESEVDVNATLDSLMERANHVVDRSTEVEKRRHALRTDVERLTAEIRQTLEEEERAAAALTEWTQGWKDAVAVLGLPVASTTVEAQTVLEGLENLFAKLAERLHLKQRISGIDRDTTAYQQRVEALVKIVAPDLSARDMTLAVEELKSRLRKATDLQAEHRALTKQMEEQRKNAQRHKEELASAADALSVMCAEAGCQSADDLLPVAKQSQEAERYKERIAEIDERLVPLAGDSHLAEFISMVESADADAVDAEIETLTDAIDLLQKQLQSLNQTIGSETTELGRMNGTADAADTAQQIQGVLARLRDDAEEYIRLRVAEHLLHGAVERYREKTQSPVLQKASTIFAGLTRGSFAGVKSDVDDQDTTVLKGIRGSIEGFVGIDGMSEGTRDQLYLALRLASVEHILSGHEPIPFILDDVLVNFDDERAAAALRALADLSCSAQVILFTHHAHIVALARQSLAAQDLFIHTIENQQMEQSRAMAAS